MKTIISLPAPDLNTLHMAVQVDFGQSSICDAVDFGTQRACRNHTAWYRDQGAWALCRGHAYNEVEVDAARRRR
jgi:hypothetical protein